MKSFAIMSKKNIKSHGIREAKSSEPTSRQHSLEELLAQCDATTEVSAEERAWLNSKPVGKEI